MMDDFTVYAIYSASVLLTVLPLVCILWGRSLQRDFAYFVATSSFLCLNLAGTISPSIGRWRSLAYQLVFLLISASLFVLYLAICAVARGRRRVSLGRRLAWSLHRAQPLYRVYTGFLLMVSAFGMLIYFRTVSSPLVFRFDLYGRWDELVGKRIEMVQSRPFHWYVLAAVEIPLFLTILVSVVRALLRDSLSPRQAVGWGALVWGVTLWSAAASVLFLNKQYVVYLLAALALVSLVFHNRPSTKALGLFVAGSAASLTLLYLPFRGLKESESLQAIWATVGHRVFMAYPQASAIALDMFPKDVPYLDGRSFINYFDIFDFDPVDVASMIYPRMYGGGKGSAPVPAIFESYANFGWPGIVGSIVIVVAFVFGVTLMSWTRNAWVFALSVYLALKTILFWQAPLWYGALEGTLLVLVAFLFLSFETLRVAMAPGRPRDSRRPEEGRESKR